MAKKPVRVSDTPSAKGAPTSTTVKVEPKVKKPVKGKPGRGGQASTGISDSNKKK